MGNIQVLALRSEGHLWSDLQVCVSKNVCAPLLFNYDIYSAMPSKLTYGTLNAYSAAALGLDPLKMWSRLNKVIKEDPKTMCLISSSQETTHVWTQGRYSHCYDLDMINPKIPVSLIDAPQMLGLLRETQCEVLGPWGVSLVEIQMALGRATLRAGPGPTQDSPFLLL